MHLGLEQKLQTPAIEALIAALPDPPQKMRQGIEAFYKQYDPEQTHRLVLGTIEVYGWQNALLHKEAAVRLSWKDLLDYKKEKFEPATILGTFLDFGCATMDSATGEITVTETVPANTPNRREKQAIIDYLLAQQKEGHWIVGGIKRLTVAEILAHNR